MSRTSAAPRLKALAAADAARGLPVLPAWLQTPRFTTSPSAYRLRARLHWNPAVGRLGFFEVKTRRVPEIHALPDPLARPHGRPALDHRKPVEALSARRWTWSGCRAPYLGMPWPVCGRRRRAARGSTPGGIPDRDEIDAESPGFDSSIAPGRSSEVGVRQRSRFDLPMPLTVPIGAFFQGNRHLIGALFNRVAELAGNDGKPMFDLHAGVGFLAAAALSAGPRGPSGGTAPGGRPAAAKNLPAAEVAIGRRPRPSSRIPPGPSEEALVDDRPAAHRSDPVSAPGSLATWRPRRILMLGCDPATWARDAGFLLENGYHVRSVEFFDLFPSTHHVEILAVLERR